ncbi:MAG: hypothetical protein K0R59_968 [Sphingobacterium sp.]|jgi:hypothetical protein|uniref:hypothetical protein n=1 Tax=unclassified Sphingobacterium TaxID=2609468 RepID=UPI000986C515|nr:hypothetical protein [Sphingobacterium sp. CZ-UAM]MDF2515672.1 hypothetical protein [Sphingobacterium sp.]OOG17867.1 hypothetical protein BWD42_11215 [Sphingobacterium sp. CZ-UAM]
MINYFKLFALSVIFIAVGACKSNDDNVFCAEIYIPMVSNINYVNENGKDLIFSDNPLYPVEGIEIYKIAPNDQHIPLSFTINSSQKFIAVNLEKMENGTFYIRLKSDVIDRISYTAKIDESDPCRDYKLKELRQNDKAGQYDTKTQVWTFKK